ncbi:hypothetical protein SUGI_0356910 [Cryptomeria japonica]|nr:hypothetical protein SUGI_0356910 [Cryptomeria japonica]
MNTWWNEWDDEMVGRLTLLPPHSTFLKRWMTPRGSRGEGSLVFPITSRDCAKDCEDANALRRIARCRSYDLCTILNRVSILRLV